MIRRFLPFVVSVLTLVAGAFGGDALRVRYATPEANLPAAAVPGAVGGDVEAAHADVAADGSASAATGDGQSKASGKVASFRFPQQFFVPVVRGGDVQAMMILSLSIETPADQQEAVFKKENQLRDALLRQLLIHANTGGFDGNFTAEAHTALLRRELLVSAQKIAGDAVLQVLIGDISKQDGRA